MKKNALTPLLPGVLLLAGSFMPLRQALAQRLVAFPGAEGAGKYTTGGRGPATAPTTVCEVTSLDDTNTPGTLRYALTRSLVRRTVVFRVCGTIHLTSRLNIPANTTLAGQTAPGAGICVADKQVSVNGDNVIVRFMRFRLGDRYQNLGMVNGSGDEDALDGVSHNKIIIDHCTASWSNDEALTFYRGDSLTLQWNLISEPLNYSYHFETGDTDYEHHGYGGIWGGKAASFHHNLFAHCQGRNPRFAGCSTYTPAVVGVENVDFRNNVVYDWGGYSSNGGEGGNYNMVNNYYKYGPSTAIKTTSGVQVRQMIVNPSTSVGYGYGKFYITGNYMDSAPAVTQRNWRGVAMAGGALSDTVQSKVSTPFNLLAAPTQSAQDAYTTVLQRVGCVLPVRDALDARIIQDVQNRTGTVIDVQGGYPHGTPYSTSQVAWPTLTCGPAPTDTDHDGMPDAWETSNGLNPNNAADQGYFTATGYTNLENYLNSLVAGVVLSTNSVRTVQFGIYPNPAGDYATLLHPGSAQDVTVALYTADGRLVTTATVPAGAVSTTLPLSNLAAGLYLVQYRGATGNYTAKLVRQ